SLLEGGRALRECAVGVLYEGGNGKLVALLSVAGDKDAVYVIDKGLVVACSGGHSHCGVGAALPGLGYVNLDYSLAACIDSVVVHLYDGVALLGVGGCEGIVEVNVPES